MYKTNDYVYYKEKRPLANYIHLSPVYRGRTSLSAKDLQRGIISLILLNVTRADEGNYTFLLPSKSKGFIIELLIGENATHTVGVCVCV